MFASEKYIRQLIKLVEETGMGSIEVSSWGRKVRISGSASSTNGHNQAPAMVQHLETRPLAPAPVDPTPSAPPAGSTESADTSKYVEVNSPMVGTFYAAPSPDSSAYVSLNEKVTTGQVVCIVEAMKLMNEIESEVSGRIVKILVENATPVEYGQAMFLIDPEG